MDASVHGEQNHDWDAIIENAMRRNSSMGKLPYFKADQSLLR
jgi:hypothetical protein